MGPEGFQVLCRVHEASIKADARDFELVGERVPHDPLRKMEGWFLEVYLKRRDASHPTGGPFCHTGP